MDCKGECLDNYANQSSKIEHKSKLNLYLVISKIYKIQDLRLISQETWEIN